uniref:Uncharacterized protein n=1 Tax=Vitis vinifera TaxID=29760 RepID=F6GZB7_VITVI
MDFRDGNTLRILSSGSKPELPQVKMHHLVGAKDSHQEQRETSAKYKHLASPPRIHMDSWWVARNPNQGPKWTHNIAQD